MTSSLSSRQIQATTPSAVDSYIAWTRETGQPTIITELSGNGGLEKADARLLWLGEEWKPGDGDGKKKKKVLLYFHGTWMWNELVPGST